MNRLAAPFAQLHATAAVSAAAATSALLALGLAAPLLLHASAAQARPPAAEARSALCQAGERTVFACTTARRKLLALCTPGPGQVQYRYGSAGKVELRYPPRAQEAATALRYAEYHRAQVDRRTVSFDNGEYAYTVFDGTENGRRSAGVSVQRQGQDAERTDACRGNIQGSLAPLKTQVACDRDSALNQGQCP